jgi:hypothetical protein
MGPRVNLTIALRDGFVVIGREVIPKMLQVDSRPAGAASAGLRIETLTAKPLAEFLRVLRIREAVSDPPLVLMKDAVIPLAHRKVEAKGIHQTAVRPHALDRRQCDLMRPASNDCCSR